jgi:hypothetical protein
VTPENRRKLAHRVTTAAQAALSARGYVTSIDVLLGIGWLDADAVARWRKGQVDYLERLVNANLARVSAAMALLRRWAAERGLKPSETVYRHRSHHLRFSKSGAPPIEQAYRTHWVSPALAASKPARREQARTPEVHDPATEAGD